MNGKTWRKWTAGTAAVLLACALTACGKERDTSSLRSYTITFAQAGQPDIVRVVEEGKPLTDIPPVKPVTGYTVSWEDADLAEIREDKTVNAVKTPNRYTVTYDANEGTVSETTDVFTYDAEYTLKLPVRNDYSFVCWKYGTASIALTGVWKIAENVKLTAAWEKISRETYTITFIQEGRPDVVKTLKKGETLTDVPAPAAEAGYDIVWDKTDFSDIAENTTVTAIKTARTYTIAYDLGTLKDDEYVTIGATAQKVVFGAEYTLLIPGCYGYRFRHWLRADTEEPFTGDTYSIPSDVALVAVWEKDTESDRWGEWTNYY